MLIANSSDPPGNNSMKRIEHIEHQTLKKIIGLQERKELQGLETFGSYFNDPSIW